MQAQGHVPNFLNRAYDKAVAFDPGTFGFQKDIH